MTTTEVLDARQVLFTRQVREAIAEHSAEDAAALISQMHGADVNALEARLSAAQEETQHAVMSANRGHHMVSDLLGTAGRETHRASRAITKAELAGELLRAIGGLAQTAEDGKVPVDLIQDILARPLPQDATRYPYIAAFWPSHEHSHGHFVTADGAVHQVWPFAGWAMVLHSDDRGMNALQPMFAVDGELVPACTLLMERGLSLDRFN